MRRAWATLVAAALLASGCASLNPFGGRPDPGLQSYYQPRAEGYIPSGYPLDHPTTYVSSSFGVRNGRMHNGIDFIAPKGTPVYATADGRVSFAGTQNGYGLIVCIDHGQGYMTCYAHLSKFDTREGQWVRRGEQIARVGATGNATAPHLHYEVRKYEQATHPGPYLGEPPRHLAHLSPR